MVILYSIVTDSCNSDSQKSQYNAIHQYNYLDETLNGGFYCETLIKKLKRSNGMRCKARHYIKNDAIKSLYHAIFSSHLIYGCQIWGQCTNVFNEKVFRLQNRAVRIISFSNFQAYQQVIKTH